MYDNVTIKPNDFDTFFATKRINADMTPGTYKAIARGKVAGGDWFDFDTTRNGVNPRVFTIFLDGHCSVSAGVTVSPPTTVPLRERFQHQFYA